MRHGKTLITTLSFALLVACSGSKATELDVPSGTTPGTTVDPVSASDDPAAPHALGAIVLGESHAAEGASKRIVRVTFVPDALAGQVSPHVRVVAGCELALGASADAPSSDASFEAGTIVIEGGASDISLSPPYGSEADEPGAPFASGAKLAVRSSGATDVGFERFEETFTATELLVASPPLAKLPRTSVFSTGALPITWVAGSDQVVVTVSGKGGVLRCKADDATGHFDVPREVVTTALGGAENLVLSVARERVEVRKGKKTKGADVPPAGWLSLSTTSTETASFKCSGAECTGTTIATCQDCRTSLCKTEFDACTADATCPFLRTCLDACTTSSCRNACFTKWPEAAAKTKNGALYKCQCVNRCVSECAGECS